jgi:hypothetical protein
VALTNSIGEIRKDAKSIPGTAQGMEHSQNGEQKFLQNSRSGYRCGGRILLHPKRFWRETVGACAAPMDLPYRMQRSEDRSQTKTLLL